MKWDCNTSSQVCAKCLRRRPSLDIIAVVNVAMWFNSGCDCYLLVPHPGGIVFPEIKETINKVLT
jgi:hypothetical protein